MKYEKWLSCLTGTVLAMLLSWGTAGAVVTAFDLSGINMTTLSVVCITVSVFTGLCFTVKRGGLVLLGMLALVTGFLWRRGEAINQTLSLIQQISKFYDSAYGWGIFPYGSPMGRVDNPICILGGLVAIAVNWTVCRRQSLWVTAAAVLIPICACLVVTDTVPEEVYLYPVLLGFLILVMTNTVRRKDAMQGVTLTAIVTLPLALALGLLFWLAPQKNYVNRAPDIQQQATDLFYRIPEIIEEITQQQTAEAEKDRTDKVDLDDVGPRAELSYEVMNVFGTVEGQLYLRGQDFSIYTGTGWTAGQQPSEIFPANGDILVAAGAVTIETKRVRNVLYLPYYPMEGGSMSGCFYNTDNIKRYVFTRGILPDGWQASSYRSANSSQEAQHRDGAKENYLYLPDSTRQWAQALVNSLISSDMSRTEIAETIASYVRTSAEYDLNTRKMPAEHKDFAQWFLTESETGYCIHFASAAAVLLRAADIPARYVTGYMTYVEAGKTVTVTAGDAHAWVEYYEPVLDMWIVLEATPADNDSVESRPAQQPSQQQTEPADSETEAITEPTQAPTEPPEELPEEERKPVSPWVWLILLSVLISGMLAQRMLRLWLRQRKRQGAQPNELALLLWQDVALHARLLRKRPPRVLEKLAQKAKYSQHTLTAEELEQLQNFINTAQATLKARPWYWQLLLRFAYVVY